MYTHCCVLIESLLGTIIHTTNGEDKTNFANHIRIDLGSMRHQLVNWAKSVEYVGVYRLFHKGLSKCTSLTTNGTLYWYAYYSLTASSSQMFTNKIISILRVRAQIISYLAHAFRNLPASQHPESAGNIENLDAVGQSKHYV